ncbi:hypothetical protein LB503_004978 [Fusarium chuoi]|nr:hypothetical protein LB503_004978 [Fusarium chuoi]
MSAGSVRDTAPGLDIFKTPENPTFYSANLYHNLDKSKQEIRLIELSAQTGGDGILECKLLPARLLTDARKQYLALSYCAGDPTDTKEIIVNGVRCNIFANLHHTLVLSRHYWIRSSGQGPLRIWIDQLCINQHDLKERSHQVGFMRDIYQSADRTLACLSTPTTSGEGLKWFNDLRDAVPFQEDDGPWQYNRQDELGTGDGDESEEMTHESERRSDIDNDYIQSQKQQWSRIQDYVLEHMHIDKFVDGLIAFYDVLSSPWWNRAWICQEFLVSRQVTFMFGNHFVSWKQCWRIMNAFCGMHKYDLLNRERFLASQSQPVGCPGDRQICRILDMVKQRNLNSQIDHVRTALKMKMCWRGGMDLMTLLSHSRSCKSSDDRDRVYAMLGLALPGYNILPDYSSDMSASEVMIITTRAIIEKEKSLDILVEATKLVRSRNLDIPSWVVDWSSTKASNVDYASRELYGNDFIPYESPQCKFETTTNTNNQSWHVLWVYGTCMTRIRRVTREWPVAQFYSAEERHGRALFSVTDGDEVWFLYGLRAPMVLRPYLDGYQVISSAALLGITSMLMENGRAKRRRIILY